MAITKVSSSLIDANLTITGGTVDDTVIGSGTPAAGTFTTIGGTLASSVTGTTQSAGDNSTKIATTGYVETALANMVDSAPSTLDTLNELAAALGDDANFSTTVTNSIALKAPLANPTFTGSFTSPGIDDNANAIAITIDSSENVGIGTSSVAAKLHIESSSASITPSVHSDELLVENNGNAGITIGSSTTGQGRLTFADSAGDSQGNIIYDHSDDSMDFRTADSAAMRIDSSGNVGIGTDSPNTGLSVVTGSANGIELGQDSDASTDSARLFFSTSAGSNAIHSSSGAMRFFTGSTAGSSTGTEAMRIDSSGNVAIGHTTTSGSKFAICDGANSQIQFFPEFSTDNNLTQHYDPTAAAYMNAETRAGSFTWRLGTARAMAIDSSGTVMDYITSSGGNADLRYHTGTSVVSYDTSSERFKTNIRDNTTYGLAAVNALQSRMFEYKDDGRTDVGLIAEEVAEVVPELVGLDDENNPLTVDYKRFVSVLVKAMQEQQEQIEDLKAEVAALKGE